MIALFDIDQAWPHDRCLWITRWLHACGEGARVAVLDTGLDRTILEQLHGTEAFTFIAPHNPQAPNHGWGDSSDEYHGTRIAAEIAQFAPRAKIASINVYDDTGGATRETFIEAMQWCQQANIQIANLSQGFYDDGCSDAHPCRLCRTINTAALASDLLSCIVIGDAPFVHKHVKNNDPNYRACPALGARSAWIIANQDIDDDNYRDVIRRNITSGRGLSFQTARMTAAFAIVRAIAPRADLWFIKDIFASTLIPHAQKKDARVGMGTHCPLLATLSAMGIVAALSGEYVQDDAVSAPSPDRIGQVDAQVVKVLARISAQRLAAKPWSTLLQAFSEIRKRIAPWAGPMERLFVEHAYAAALDAVGKTQQAQAAYTNEYHAFCQARHL